MEKVERLNIEADVAHAVELGAKVLSPAMAVGEFGSMATCEDPTGAAFSFWQAGQHVGSQVGEEPGSAAWYELYDQDRRLCDRLGAGWRA